MKIKEEYKGRVIVVYDSILGQKRIEVDKIDLKRIQFYVSIGLGYVFEPEAISYTGIEQENQTVKPKRRKKNG